MHGLDCLSWVGLDLTLNIPCTACLFLLLPAEMKYLGFVLEFADQKQIHSITLVAHGVSEKAEWVADIAQVSSKQVPTFSFSDTHTYTHILIYYRKFSNFPLVKCSYFVLFVNYTSLNVYIYEK